MTLSVQFKVSIKSYILNEYPQILSVSMQYWPPSVSQVLKQNSRACRALMCIIFTKTDIMMISRGHTPLLLPPSSSAYVRRYARYLSNFFLHSGTILVVKDQSSLAEAALDTSELWCCQNQIIASASTRYSQKPLGM